MTDTLKVTFKKESEGEYVDVRIMDGDELILGGCGCCDSPWMKKSALDMLVTALRAERLDRIEQLENLLREARYHVCEPGSEMDKRIEAALKEG